MAALADGFRKVVDFVMDGFRDNPFADINDEDDYMDEYEEYEDGNAVRAVEPSYAPIVEKRQEQ